jgi:hypothetical protein
VGDNLTLPLLNHCGCNQNVFKTVCMQDVLCSVVGHMMLLKCWFCGPDESALYAYAYQLYIQGTCAIEHYIRM